MAVADQIHKVSWRRKTIEVICTGRMILMYKIQMNASIRWEQPSNLLKSVEVEDVAD